MTEVCPHCKKEPATTQALASHIRFAHKSPAPPIAPPPPPTQHDESMPEGKGDQRGKEPSMAPLDTREEFKSLPTRWGVRGAKIIPEYVAAEGKPSYPTDRTHDMILKAVFAFT